uniref:RlpA-like protein double-psi beta-barrel domain-containing protein n=1 Tax=Ditylenchus dipsaci TaxID=166011 RepID=A0A915EI51_9BILA
MSKITAKLNLILLFTFTTICIINGQQATTPYPPATATQGTIPGTPLTKQASPMDAVLDKPQTGGKFTFYGGIGRGACGLDYDATIQGMSAAVSGKLFLPTDTWIPSDLPDKRSIKDDPICRGICVKIEYKGKTLTVPANNKCPECEVTHVDLSQGAFAYLEPGLGVVGIAKDATITYLKCPNGPPATPGASPPTASPATPAAAPPAAPPAAPAASPSK